MCVCVLMEKKIKCGLKNKTQITEINKYKQQGENKLKR